MIEVYLTKNKDVHRKTEILIERKISKGFTLKRTENGKPYIEGNPLYFSISHSHRFALIAVCDNPVGVDFEYYGNTFKNFEHVLSRFSGREKEWIGENPVLFISNWVSKEAFIKMNGGTLAHDLKNLQYFDGTLYCDGKCVENIYVGTHMCGGTYAICAENYTHGQLFQCKIKQFRLKKGEKI